MANKPTAPTARKRGNTGSKSAEPGNNGRVKPPRRTTPVRGAFPVVCLGAAAGGLKAYSEFLDAMPSDSGMSFVLVHHGDPDHESLMADLLQEHTDMPVFLVRDQEKLKPDQVYVIPPNRFLQLNDGKLNLTDPTDEQRLRLPIDCFLESLAQDGTHPGIAVILSGTGSDGTSGSARMREAANEKLESSKEKLTALNTQLQQKIEDERRASDDLNNLLSSSGIATVFLDRQLNILRFTPATRALFNLITSDVGRPFSDIAGKIDDQNFASDAASVLETQVALDLEVQSREGRWFIRRIMPYRTQDGEFNGVVVTYSDVTDLKKLQQHNQEAQTFADDIIDTVRAPLLVIGEDMRIARVSRSYREVFSISADELIGENLFKVQGGQWDVPALHALIDGVLTKDATLERVTARVNTADKKSRDLDIHARKLRQTVGGKTLVLLAMEDVTDQNQTQRELQFRESRLSAIVNAVPEAIITIDQTGKVRRFSPSAERLFGYSAAEVIGENVKLLMPSPDQDRHDTYIARYLETGVQRIIGTNREVNGKRKDGSIVPLRLTVSEMEMGGERNFLGILHDLSEERKRRSELERAQKMEAVGQLTGGLAHDFNNLLTVVIGNLELLELQLTDEKRRSLLNEALEASTLGATLTSKLLAFSKSQALEPEYVSLNDLVDSMYPLLKRTLGAHIEIDLNLAEDLDLTLADPGQIESALLNLTINARDAMPDGGKLTIETANVNLDKDYAAAEVDVTAGAYVALLVTDSGAGMPPEVVEHVFEPFFTTKGPSAGSGLGLSMVYGFVKQSEGHVTVYSEEGRGTTLTLYLPASTAATDKQTEPDVLAPSAANQETVLVVEDDARVRRLTANRLEKLGYQVLTAEDGPSAIDIIKSTAGIELLLSDVVMPGGMTGPEVCDQALRINPNLKVLLATGYGRGAETTPIGTLGMKPIVLRKPYGIRDLAEALHSLLKEPKR